VTDDQKHELMLAILAMDSYNQGYGAGLVHGATNIGGSIKFTPENADESNWQTTGFYAASYNLTDGTTVISYRGTDASPDYTKGWVIAVGDIADGTQAPQALEFYNAVTNKTYADGAQSKVVLTGHSLGGLLAGYVAALSGTNAHTFDHAPFALAALAKYIIDNGMPPNPGDWLSFLHLAQIKGEFVDNEILESARNGDIQLVAGVAALLIPLLGEAIAAYGVSLSAVTAAFEAFIAKTPIESHSGISELSANPLTGFSLADRALKLHMMDYLVNLKFAGIEKHTAWHSDGKGVGEELASSYFDDKIALAAGFTDALVLGASSHAGKMGRAIAYSALEKGGPGLVFGDSAIRAMFDDLDDLGRAYSKTNLDSLLKLDINGHSSLLFHSGPWLKQAFTDIAVQYAGALAGGKIEIADANAAADGLDIERGVFGTGVDKNTLALDISSILWKDVFQAAGSPVGPTGPVQPFVPSALYANEIRNLHLSQFKSFKSGGFLGFGASLDLEIVSAFVTAIWNRQSTDEDGGAYKAIDRFHFRVPADIYEVVMSDRSYKLKDGHGPEVHIDAYHGGADDAEDVIYSTLGNDLIFVNGGNDKVFLRGGRDYVQAGEGYDTLVDRITVNLNQSPRPDNVPADAPFDDIFVGLTADEDQEPWQMLLKAYASEEFFKDADEYRYSVAKKPERLQAANGKDEGDNAAKLDNLRDPKFDRKGVHLRDLAVFEGLAQLAQQEGFEYLANDNIGELQRLAA
jgi:Protein of unknown function (DUF2974)